MPMTKQERKRILTLASLDEFHKALYGSRGELDAWLEVNDEEDARMHMKALIEEEKASVKSST